MNFLNCSTSFTICRHSSLVGQTTSACGYFCAASTSCKSGRPNAAVFPVPVCANPTRSFVPLNNTGMACSCMGVGSLNPRASVACTSRGSRPNPSNVIISFSIWRKGTEMPSGFLEKYPFRAFPFMMGLRPPDPWSVLWSHLPLFNDSLDLIRILHELPQILAIFLLQTALEFPQLRNVLIQNIQHMLPVLHKDRQPHGRVTLR